METLSFEFPAGQPPRGRALVGCVGSGDLEVLIEPGQAGKLTIQVQTSVNGARAALAAPVCADVRRPDAAGDGHRYP